MLDSEAFKKYDSAANDGLMKMVKPIKSLYIDLGALYDFRLGALLGMITTDIEYNYIWNKLQSYNQSKCKSITDIFPALEITDEMVDDFIQDPNNAIFLSRCAPVTSVYGELPLLLNDLIDHNRRVGTSASISITFNCVDFKYDSVAGSRLAHRLLKLIPTLKIAICSKNIAYERDEFILQFDRFYINNLQNFLGDIKSNTYNLYFNKLKFLDKSLYVLANIDLSVYKEHKDLDANEVLQASTHLLGACCDIFEFINYNVLVE